MTNGFCDICRAAASKLETQGIRVERKSGPIELILDKWLCASHQANRIR